MWEFSSFYSLLQTCRVDLVNQGGEAKKKKGNIRKRRDYKTMRMKKQKDICERKYPKAKSKNKGHTEIYRERKKERGGGLAEERRSPCLKKTFLSSGYLLLSLLSSVNLIVRFCLPASSAAFSACSVFWFCVLVLVLVCSLRLLGNYAFSLFWWEWGDDDVVEVELAWVFMS